MNVLGCCRGNGSKARFKTRGSRSEHTNHEEETKEKGIRSIIALNVNVDEDKTCVIITQMFFLCEKAYYLFEHAVLF